MRTGVIAAVLVTLALAACKGSEPPGGDAKPPPPPPPGDGFCRYPKTLAEACDLPPNAYSKDKIYCHGCNCAGATAMAACNGNGDCRYFATSCIPQSYTPCQPGAPDFILALCGYCFFREAGGVPADCNKLLFDGGAGKQ